MYDTIKIWLERELFSNPVLLNNIPNYLSNVERRLKLDNTNYITGNLKNFRVIVRYSGVTISGSLSKYYLGNNFENLTIQDVKKAIKQLSLELHAPISEAKISRLDIGYCFIIKNNPEVYFNYLGNCQYFKRNVWSESLYYKNDIRTKVFYDKIVESKKKKNIIPVEWIGKNVLRYEYRLTQRVAKRLNRSELKVSDLYNEKIHKQLFELYIKEYENITKINTINFNLKEMKTPKDFWEWQALQNIENNGLDKTLELIDEMKSIGVFKNKNYYSRLKRELVECYQKPKTSMKNSIISELDEKIKNLKNNY